MADNSIPLFPVADLLLALGARPGKYKNTYHSPFREDTNASLHIDPRKNVWYDHGAGIGGGNIDLVMRCRGCSAREAADYILSLPQSGGSLFEQSSSDTPPQKKRPMRDVPLTNRILMTRNLRSPYLLDYIESRGIPSSIAIRYCCEVILRGKKVGKTYDHIGFPNNNGGFALKSPSGFKSTTKSGITTIDMQGNLSEQAMSDTVSIFEGVFDFLSWLASKDAVIPPTDVVVLNSVSNVARTIPYLRLHKTIICYLDNDEAGKAALETIKSLRRELHYPTIIDGSLFYYNYNDMNDWWIATRQLKQGKQ